VCISESIEIMKIFKVVELVLDIKDCPQISYFGEREFDNSINRDLKTVA
jgi:hypothetical protein